MNPRRFRRLKAVLEKRQPDLTVLMERVNKTHNFSAILRNCDAVGVLEAHAVLPEKGLDLHNHVSGGTSKWLNVETHDRTPAAIQVLHDRGFTVLAAHPAPDALDFREVDLVRPVALMVGAELDGISPEGVALADEIVAIPMMGMARSLNVSVATALILYEALAQRRRAGLYQSCRIPEPTYSRLLFEWAHPEVADLCRRREQAYPSLSEDGEILD